MPYVLPLAVTLRRAGWKVKIHDSERLEPPHATIYRKLDRWRLSLRDGEFLETGDKWSQIDPQVRAVVEAHWDLLIANWNELHPDNPVAGANDE